MRRPVHCLATAVLTSIAAAPAIGSAATLFGVTESGYLVHFDSATPNAATTIGLLGGLGASETVIGIDFRPATGQLYAATDGNRLYTVDTATAFATGVGPLTPEFSGSRFGFDFNPVPDRLRIVSDADQNLRCNPNAGSPACLADTALTFAAGDVNTGRNPNVVGAAYTNSFAGTATTALYGIDSTLNALVFQNPPNAGVLTTVGSLGVNTTDLVGFDILSVDGLNLAFASLTQTGSFLSRLYAIDLLTGQASPVGGNDFTSLIGAGDQLRALAVAGSMAPVPLPAGIWLLGSAISALVLRRRSTASGRHAAP